LETLIVIGSIGVLLAILVASSQNERLNNAGLALTLILWIIMLGIAIWTAALITVKKSLLMRLRAEDLTLALEAVDAVSAPTLPSVVLTALAFLSGGMVILPLLIGDRPQRRR
jgi:hypothetical protein